MSTLNWGILGTGAIAKTLARALGHCKTGKLAAVGSRSRESADKFGDEFHLPAAGRHASYEALLADPNVQVVYISTPHPLHAQWAIRALEAGKHVLCEKPLAMNYWQGMAVFEAAARAQRFAMEAFMYRCHPQTAKLVELLGQKAIGQVRVIQATFSFHAGFNPASRLFANDLAGGGIMDVGCYTASIARLLAGAASGQPFLDPVDVKGQAHLGSTGVDEWAIASLKFPGDILAQLATGVSLNQENVVRIFGSDGKITVPNPYVADRAAGGISKIILHPKGQEPQEIAITTEVTAFALEADAVGAAILAGRTQAAPPAMTWDDTLGNLKTLDAWRESIGLVFNEEKPDSPRLRQTAAARPLAVSPTARMKYGEIAGVGKKVSRLVMGVDNQRAITHASVMFDDFFEQGGNAFDTAFLYGGGACEKVLGQWIQNRGLRQQVVVLGKGAHTPFCDPESLSKQLLQTLERLQTDYLDIYAMHRDNPEVPVGEFVDVINEHLKAGRLRAFGGSNWTLERFKKANAYARRKGLTGFAMLSNNFSLARMVDAPWAGCIAASDPVTRKFLKKTQTPLMSWSSQARGFFTDRATADTTDKELRRCWYSDDNFQRRERCLALAREKGALPIQIALAYVLCQPFPTFALIGPRTLAETRTSLPALDVVLSEREVKWLNLESDKR